MAWSMSANSVLLLATLVGSVAGMCFDNKSPSAPREVVKPAHTVGSIEGCKAACWSSATCLAFTYNPISTECVLLGAVKEGICAGKGFYPHVKCAATVNCDYFSAKTASFATSGGLSAFPRCQLKGNFVSTKNVCVSPPPEIICEHSQCFCKDPTQQLVVIFSLGPWIYCGVRAVCAEDSKYTILAPGGRTQSLVFSISDAVCTTIARTSYEKCMYDMPFISGGIRDGDKLCGDKKLKNWGYNGQENFVTNLKCTPDGWSDGQKVVKPEYVRCE